MIAIDNSALISNTSGLGIPPVDLSLFTAAATWAYNSGAGTITVTSTATATAPDTFEKANVAISDNQGTTVYGVITTVAGNTGAVDVSSLNTSGPMTIQVTMASTLGVQASGQSDYVSAGNASGSIGYWAYTASTNTGA